jgi:UDP-N-acetylglucosamine 2-epimerase (non-hydrolysing)
MVDSLLASLPKAQESDVLDRLGVTGSFALATLHRPALVDDVDRLGGVLVALSKISDDVPVLFPVHPRTRQRILDAGLEHVAAGVQLCDPVGYLDFVRLESAASLVLTDSGGVQEETTVLGVPCLTLRPNTERPMTITEGTNRLVGLDPADIVAAAEDALTNGAAPRRPALWDGHTAERVAAVLSRGEPAVEWVPPAVREHTR